MKMFFSMWNPYYVHVQCNSSINQRCEFFQISFHIWLPRITIVKFSSMFHANHWPKIYVYIRYKYSTSDLKTVPNTIFYFTLFAFFALFFDFFHLGCAQNQERTRTRLSNEMEFRSRGKKHTKPKHNVNWWKPLEIHSHCKASERKTMK